MELIINLLIFALLFAGLCFMYLTTDWKENFVRWYNKRAKKRRRRRRWFL